MRYIHGWKRQTIALISLVLTLAFIIACGSTAPAAPEAQKEAPQAPAVQQEAAKETTAEKETPKEAAGAPTAVPEATVAPPAVVEPEGTLNAGLKEVGPFLIHPVGLGNPQIFVHGQAPIGEALLQQDFSREIKGLLAESWSISDDFLTWTFKLNKEVQFHKGYGEMTSEDVMWSMRQWALSKHPRAAVLESFWAERPGTETPDPYTVVVNSGEPVV